MSRNNGAERERHHSNRKVVEKQYPEMIENPDERESADERENEGETLYQFMQLFPIHY